MFYPTFLISHYAPYYRLVLNIINLELLFGIKSVQTMPSEKNRSQKALDILIYQLI